MPLTPQQFRVTDADVAEFHERGYWISPPLLDAAEIAQLREEVMRTVRGEKDFDTAHWFGVPKLDPKSARLIQVCNGWWVNRTIRQAVSLPILGSIGARLMNTPEVRIWHDQVLYKPGVGPEGQSVTEGNVGWHQDAAHWQIADTQNFCTAWVALQDTDLTNGGMRTIVGSHKWGLYEDAYSFGEKDLDALRKKYDRGNQPWIDEPCILKAGQASFHHALTFHGSGPNLSTQDRLSFVVHMMPKGCAYNPRGMWHPNGVLLGPDAKEGLAFEGPYFPRIWPVATTSSRNA